MFRTLSAVLLLAFSAIKVDAEEMYELIGNVFLIAEDTIDFDGCEYDKSYTIAGYVFVCSTYGYTYHYGQVKLLGREFTHDGRIHIFAYICLEGEDECYDGKVFKLQ